MNTTTVKQATSKPEVIKPVKKDTELNLDQILAQEWNLGLSNGILGGF